MKRVLEGCIGFAVMMAALCLAGEASAATLVSPYGAMGVEARIGQEANFAVPGAQPYVIWRRKTDGHCTLQTFGTGAGALPGLTESMVFQGGSGGDTLIVQAANDNVTCGNQTILLGPVGGNGHQLQIMGLGGNDVVLGGFPTTLATGDGGADIVSIQGAPIWVTVDGGSSGDDISSFGLFGAEIVIGGDGNDCIWDENSTVFGLDCGPGIGDTYRTGTSSFGPIANCEGTNLCCSWPHLAGKC